MRNNAASNIWLFFLIKYLRMASFKIKIHAIHYYTSGEVADPNDVKGLFHALTEGGCGGLIGPTKSSKNKVNQTF